MVRHTKSRCPLAHILLLYNQQYDRCTSSHQSSAQDDANRRTNILPWKAIKPSRKLLIARKPRTSLEANSYPPSGIGINIYPVDRQSMCPSKTVMSAADILRAPQRGGATSIGADN